MKKVAIAAAVAGAFATSATAAELSTFIYQDYALQFNSNSSATATKDYSEVTVGDAGSNMVNFNYSDDLGNGLGLIGSFSMTARGGAAGNATSSSGGIANRNSFIGLTGDFGKVTVGTHELLAELEVILKDGWDANYGGGGDPVRITRIGKYSTSTAHKGFTARVNNAIEWTSPDMNGLTLNVGYVENAGASSTVDATGTEVNAVYSVGGVRLSAGVGSHDDYGATAGDTLDFSYLTVGYDFGTASVSIGMANVEYYDKDEANTYSTGSANISQSGNHINVTVPMANGKFIANYMTQGDREEDGTVQTNSGISGYDFGYLHDASANTKLYVRYLSQSIDSDYATATGAQDTDSLMVGMRYVY
jgi:hypothetical protein